MKRTKIVCTVGPACCKPEILKQLIVEGMNVARFNMSHGTHESHKAMIDDVKQIRSQLGLPVAIMIDTKGPEVRVGQVENGKVTLVDNQEFVLTSKQIVGNQKMVSISYAKLPSLVTKGTKILLDDGNIQLVVKSTSATEIVTKVLHGGELASRKGVNVPSVDLQMPYISNQDKADIQFACEQKADLLAISFVSCADDVLQVRKLLAKFGRPQMKIISKIESRGGVENAHQIIEVSDGIMVARGDLGVEIDFAKIPEIQKELIAHCNAYGKLSITATQMMESMIKNPRPTRAEISDVANAIFDGTACVMLSGETSAGQYPVLTVKTMAQVISQAEEHQTNNEFMYYQPENDSFYGSFGYAAAALNYSLQPKTIVCATKGGDSAIAISKYRPACTILGCTFVEDTYQLLSAYYGVQPMLRKKLGSMDAQIDDCILAAKQAKLVKKGDKVVITCGISTIRDGGSNCIVVETIS